MEATLSPTRATPWQSAVHPIVMNILQSRDLPGMIVAVARRGQPPEFLVMGVDGDGLPLTIDSLFPVASITKLATALAILRLVAEGTLALDAPLGQYLPDAVATGEEVTLRRLLAHTAGLPNDLADGIAPYAPGLDWPTLARACLATPLSFLPGTRVYYSNVGPGLLAIIVERIMRLPFPQALEQLVLTPLGIEGYLGTEPPRSPIRLTGELGEHAGTALEPFNSPFWRSLAMPWGGMLTTAAGALALVRAYLDEPEDFLPAALREEARRDQSNGLPGEMAGIARWPRCAWGLGVDLHGDKHPHFAPPRASPFSFGHAGASGCLAWLDPEAEVAWAILGTCTFGTWWQDWPILGAAIQEGIQ